jgi:hypothetical protein
VLFCEWLYWADCMTVTFHHGAQLRYPTVPLTANLLIMFRRSLMHSPIRADGEVWQSTNCRNNFSGRMKPSPTVIGVWWPS